MALLNDIFNVFTGNTRRYQQQQEERYQQERRLAAELEAAKQIAPKKAEVSAAKLKSLTTPVGGYGGAYDPTTSILNSALAKIAGIYSQIPQFTPKAFDEAAAKASVTQSTDEYYTSKINDFLKGVDLQLGQSAETETRLLNNITAGTERYTEFEKKQYDIAKEDALSQVVGSGRQLSGMGATRLGRQSVERRDKLNDYLAGQAERRADIEERGDQFGEKVQLGRELTIGDYTPGGGFSNLGGEYGRQRKLGIEQGVATRAAEHAQTEQLRSQQYYDQLAAKQKSAAAKVAAENPSIAGFLGGYF